MKKRINVVIVIIIFLITLCIGANSFAFNNKEEVPKNQIFEYVISFEEPVITADFSVLYDSNKLTYIGANTNELKINLNYDNSKILACYYDVNKIGTTNIVLKFKANTVGTTKINVENIIVHTKNEEKVISDLSSKNIKIVDKVDNKTENSLNENIDKANENIANNSSEDETIKKIDALPFAGVKDSYIYLFLIVIIIILLILILTNKNLDKKRKIIFSFAIIFVGVIAFTCKYIFATSDDKILINKNNKNILVVLSTGNETRSMNLQTFKERTKAIALKNGNVELNDNSLITNGNISSFSNKEDYTIQLYGDENNNGYINSSDIYELINKGDINNTLISEICDFIIKKEEFKNYDKEGFEEFNENSITNSVPSIPLEPATDRYTQINNIDELKNLDAKIGEKYKTLGYYEANDGGAGRYDIIENNSNLNIDNGLYIQLNNGLIAALSVRNNTVNVKQFGARGNGINDDVLYLRKALNSGIENIEIPNGEYKITDIIKMEKENVNVIGNNSTIFTDDDYNPERKNEFLFIMQSNNCNLNNVNIEARETKNIESLYNSQVYVGATNINILGCSFKVPETTSSQHAYNNIDLYSNWHNVLVENCNLYLAHDGSAGGCIWIRDFHKRGVSDVTFKNNICYKKCHDEILAVFSGSIENVNILNNTFIMPESTDPSTMSFTLGSGSNTKAENIRFEDNTIDVKATMDLLVSKNATNLSIKNNKIKFERITTLTNTFLIYFPENNLKDVKIENNDIEIYNKTEKTINGIISSNSQNILFNNNTVTANCEISEAFSGCFENTNNTIIFNEPVTIFINKPKMLKNNNVTFNKGFGAIAQYYKGGMNYDSNIIDNTFENKYDEISANGKSILLMFNGGSLENHTVNFEGNTIKSEKGNISRNLIYALNLADENAQTINIKNNNISGYKDAWRDKNQEKHNVFMQ